ncbi:MAG TPA: adventurous gliding motility TPR repeat lipoprotein GltE [Myxococcaceae bacterium]|nr:adventurous gliding motility TPR repeat lipoprotein GltE [Myxococcaceae bacterium]
MTVSSSRRLVATACAALLATACATSAPAEKAPPVTAPAVSTSAASTPNTRAMLLFEDATKAAEAQAKSGAGDDAALERRFEAVRQADPTFAEADYNLGVLAERQGKREQAYASYRSALQKKPSLKPAAEGLARLTRAQGDLPSAIAQWNDVARAFADDAESRSQLAELYRMSGDHDRAQEFARQALIRDPKNLDAYKTLLRSNLDRKQFAMAELVGVRALKISTTDPDLYLAIGDTQLAKGAVDKAAAQYQKALEASPTFVPARLALARLALRDEDFAAAEKHLSRAVADGGGTAEVHLDLGVAYRGLGQPDKALAEYEAAEKLQPRLAAVYLNRGIVMQRYKDAPEKSLELYKQYVSLSGGESALPNDAPVFALRREAEALVAAKSQARAQDQQAKTLEQAQKLQQQRLKDAEDRAAKGAPAKGTAADTGKDAPDKL